MVRFFWFLIRLLIWERSFSLMYTFIVINFPLRTSFVPSVKFWWYSFSFFLSLSLSLFWGEGCLISMAPHSSTLAWKIPWMEDPGRLQSMGSLRSDMTARLRFHFSLSCTGEGNGNPLQCSCLENPRDGGAWSLPSMGSHRVRHDWSNLVVVVVISIVWLLCYKTHRSVMLKGASYFIRLSGI